MLIGERAVKTDVDLPGFDCRGQSVAKRIVLVAQSRLRGVAVFRCVREEVCARVVQDELEIVTIGFKEVSANDVHVWSELRNRIASRFYSRRTLRISGPALEALISKPTRPPTLLHGTPGTGVNSWGASPLYENGNCLEDSIPNVTNQY
jgi:hypothetical protein